jgi:SpoVK/Ycf46/Vps4 family AAA+-type ATPase
VGKTTVARIIAGDVKVPLVYVPIESIMSKWYGQSSQNLSMIFETADEIGGAIIFLDEIDALAGSRDQNMFEATRRVLSVLLRKLDGIDSVTSTVTIGPPTGKTTSITRSSAASTRRSTFRCPTIRSVLRFSATTPSTFRKRSLQGLLR